MAPLRAPSDSVLAAGSTFPTEFQAKSLVASWARLSRPLGSAARPLLLLNHRASAASLKSECLTRLTDSCAEVHAYILEQGSSTSLLLRPGMHSLNTFTTRYILAALATVFLNSGKCSVARYRPAAQYISFASLCIISGESRGACFGSPSGVW